MKQKFLVLGGDLRSVKLAQELAKDGNKVYTYALEKSQELEDNNITEKCNSLKQALDSSEIIICPIPFSSNSLNINSPFSDEKIDIEELMKNKKKSIFIAGNIKNDMRNKLKDYYTDVIDVMKREELAVLNTIATAEGAIEVAIKNTDKILQGSKVLILGFGRVAKIVANKFYSLSANVTCSARKTSDLAWINAYGYNALDINNLLYELSDFDIIINTVPEKIIGEKELKHMNPNVLLIDLASHPGGFDDKMAINMGLKFVWALALPGKVAPVTSAKFIKETIYNIIEEMSKDDE